MPARYILRNTSGHRQQVNRWEGGSARGGLSVGSHASSARPTRQAVLTSCPVPSVLPASCPGPSCDPTCSNGARPSSSEIPRDGRSGTASSRRARRYGPQLESESGFRSIASLMAHPMLSTSAEISAVCRVSRFSAFARASTDTCGSSLSAAKATSHKRSATHSEECARGDQESRGEGSSPLKSCSGRLTHGVTPSSITSASTGSISSFAIDKIVAAVAPSPITVASGKLGADRVAGPGSER